MAEPPQPDEPDRPDQTTGGKCISIYSGFSLKLSSVIPLIFRENRVQIFASMRAAPSPQTSRLPPTPKLCESLQRCVKGKHAPHSEWQGSLSPSSYLCDEVFSSSELSGYRPLHFPKQNLRRGDAYTCNNIAATPRLPLSEDLFFFSRAPL